MHATNGIAEMPVIAVTAPRLRKVAAIAAATVGMLVCAGITTSAQVVKFVNGEPITATDVTQRMKMIEISTHKAPSREEALQELIDEKLKIQVGKKYGLEVSDTDVDNSFNTMARRSGVNAQQFAQQLTQAGVNVAALKRRIKADITWSQIVRGKFPSISTVGDKDISIFMETRKVDEKEAAREKEAAYLFTLRPILFIVPRGSPDGVVEARRHEAEGLRTRFQTCEEGLALARALRDVAVREQITRTSTDIGAQQRAVLDGTQLGHLTPPEVTRQGIELFAVCAKTPVRGETVGKHQVREEVLNSRYNEQAKRFLEELRRSAMIEPR
jgi:peptidyl-prolyl cis-trans isomerase SurA